VAGASLAPLLLLLLLLYRLGVAGPVPSFAQSMPANDDTGPPVIAQGLAWSIPLVAAVPPSGSARPSGVEQVEAITRLSEQQPRVAVRQSAPIAVEAVAVLAEIVAPRPETNPPPVPGPEATVAAQPPARSAPEGLLTGHEAGDDTVTLPAEESSTSSGSTPYSYEMLFQYVAAQYELDWHLLASLAYHESRINPNAVGSAREMGLMQIIPSTWDLIAPRLGLTDSFEPYGNVLAGAYYLDAMQQQFARQGFPEMYWALAAYNWGPVNLTNLLAQGGEWTQVPVEVQWYVWRVLTEAATPTAAWWETHIKRPLQ
jgi:soluble lytic murein transglycosylase-like protein